MPWCWVKSPFLFDFPAELALGLQQQRPAAVLGKGAPSIRKSRHRCAGEEGANNSDEAEAEGEANANVDNDSDSTSDVESIVNAGAQRPLDIEKAEQRSRNNTTSTAKDSTAPGNNDACRQRNEDGRAAATENTTAVNDCDYRRLKNWEDIFMVRAACARRICELCLRSLLGW